MEYKIQKGEVVVKNSDQEVVVGRHLKHAPQVVVAKSERWVLSYGDGLQLYFLKGQFIPFEHSVVNQQWELWGNLDLNNPITIESVEYAKGNKFSVKVQGEEESFTFLIEGDGFYQTNDPLAEDEEEMMDQMQAFFDKTYKKVDEKGLGVLPVDTQFVYLIFDCVGITHNAGVGAWIHYHHEQEGWLDRVQEGFFKIGHPLAANCLKRGLELYRKDPKWELEECDDVDQYLFKYPFQIYTSLYALFKSL